MMENFVLVQIRLRIFALDNVEEIALVMSSVPGYTASFTKVPVHTAVM